MFRLVQVILGIFFLFGNGFCQGLLNYKHIRNRTNQISCDMYEMLQLKSDLVSQMAGGVVASPVMAIAPLAVLRPFSYGLTKRQLNDYLDLDHAELASMSPLNLQYLAKNRKNITLLALSKTFVQKGLKLSNGFIESSRRQGVETDVMNFRFPEESAIAINKWAAERTNGSLQDVAEPQWVDKYTEVLMVNVLYFKGIWKNQFEEETQLKVFAGDSPLNFKVLTYMTQLEVMLYHKSPQLNIEIVIMPFSDADFEFILIKPASYQVEFVANVSRVLQMQPSILQDLMDRCTPRLINLALPKVKISSVIDLKETLKALGVTNLFDWRVASLENMFEDGRSGHISKMMQKVEVDLDTMGVAAATGVLPDAERGVYRSQQSNVEVIEVRATRPFLFQIRFKGSPLFMGAFEGKLRL